VIGTASRCTGLHVLSPDAGRPAEHGSNEREQGRMVRHGLGNRSPTTSGKTRFSSPTGQVVDILLDVTHAGRWMAHCHIAEHLESGMMLNFTVDA
jgi:FtsP/CotA-like multicopper oxidase with cupredoxin domain